MRLTILGAALLLCFFAAAEPTPLRWGFDDIGVRGRDCWNEGCLTEHPKAAGLLEEFQFNLWVTWYPDAAPQWGTERNIAYIRKLDAFCGERGIQWMPNTLSSLWNTSPESAVDPHGHDWYKRPDGRRFFLFPEALLAAFGNCKNLLGIVYDEPEHHQGCANAIQGLDLPSIYDPRGDALSGAALGHTKAVRELAAHHAKYGLKLHTEQVFPVMFHDFAAAGWTPGTKILKETWSPIYLACALGASWQYGTELSVCLDLWGVQGYPAHGPEAYRDALRLAYHLGADTIYTESLALDEGGKGVGSLVLMTPEDYTVTPHGEVAKAFIREYVPAHPRRYTAREVRPRVVIIRQEDGCWGQRNAPYPWTPDRLFGHPEWKSTPETEAWFAIWHLLTRGAVPRDGMSWWTNAHRGRAYQVFCPLDGVIVLDHTARAEHLRGVEVIFLTGIGISKQTQEAVVACVRQGATCIGLPHLTPPSIRAQANAEGLVSVGEGTWVVTDSFLSDIVREKTAPVLPEAGAMRYRFGNTEVTLHCSGKGVTASRCPGPRSSAEGAGIPQTFHARVLGVPEALVGQN